jgi:hypothetical protein
LFVTLTLFIRSSLDEKAAAAMFSVAVDEKEFGRSAVQVLIILMFKTRFMCCFQGSCSAKQRTSTFHSHIWWTVDHIYGWT